MSKSYTMEAQILADEGRKAGEHLWLSLECLIEAGLLTRREATERFLVAIEETFLGDQAGEDCRLFIAYAADAIRMLVNEQGRKEIGMEQTKSYINFIEVKCKEEVEREPT